MNGEHVLISKRSQGSSIYFLGRGKLRKEPSPGASNLFSSPGISGKQISRVDQGSRVAEGGWCWNRPDQRVMARVFDLFSWPRKSKRRTLPLVASDLFSSSEIFEKTNRAVRLDRRRADGIVVLEQARSASDGKIFDLFS